MDMPADEVMAKIIGLHKEMNYLKLENDLFVRYLYKKAPELLQGITGPRVAAVLPGRIHFAVDLQDDQARSRGSSRPQETSMDNHSVTTRKTNVSSFAASIRTFDSASGKTRINYTMRIELCDKDCQRFSGDIDSMRSEARDRLRTLTAQLEETRLTNTEAQHTLHEFHNFLQHAQTKMSLERFTLFYNNYVKNGNALIETMRLRNHTLKQQMIQLQKTLAIKEELSGILRPIDFEQTKNEKEELQRKLTSANTFLMGLKSVAANFRLTLIDQRNCLIQTDNNIVQLGKQIDRCNSDLARYDRVTDEISAEIVQWRERVDSLKHRMATHKVPTVMEYMQRKMLLERLGRQTQHMIRQQTMAAVNLASVRQKIRRTKAAQAIERKQRELAARQFKLMVNAMAGL